MADNDNVPTGAGGDEIQGPDRPTTVTPAGDDPVLRTRWRDRAWSFRAMAGVAAATLLVGGIVGGTVVAVADDDDDDRRFRMMPWDDDGYRVPPGMMRRGPRDFDDDDRPRWQDGPRWCQDDDLDDDTDGTTPQTPSPPVTPESTG